MRAHWQVNDPADERLHLGRGGLTELGWVAWLCKIVTAEHTTNPESCAEREGQKKGRQASLKPCSGVEKAGQLYLCKSNRRPVKTLKHPTSPVTALAKRAAPGAAGVNRSTHNQGLSDPPAVLPDNHHDPCFLSLCQRLITRRAPLARRDGRMSVRFSLLSKRAALVLGKELPHVPSPCVSVCVMHPQTAVCEGCLRDLDEIGAWGRFSDDEKRQVWRRIAQRLAATAGD
jgi:predicted Fe-S protein YdhL (DUF1289 family)